jgi:putative sigma-54 modulation protein
MRLRIKSPNLNLAQKLQKVVSSRIAKLLSRAAEKIRSLEITIRDVNGSRGGPDHRVQVVLRPTWQEKIVVRHQAADPYSGVSVATKRALQALNRSAVRRRNVLRTAHRRSQVDFYRSRGRET